MNFLFAFKRACSASILFQRARLTIAKSMSPNSSSICSLFCSFFASLNSLNSDIMQSYKDCSSGHSNPCLTAFLLIFCALISADCALEIPSIADLRCFFSSAFSLSQLSKISFVEVTFVSPKTSGCLWIILTLIPRVTSSIVNAPSSLAICACRTTCKRTSPSSSCK